MSSYLSTSNQFHWKIGETFNFTSAATLLASLLSHFRYWLIGILLTYGLLCCVLSGSVAHAVSSMGIAIVIGIAFSVIFGCLSVLYMRVHQDRVSISEDRILIRHNKQWHEILWRDVKHCELVEEPSGIITLRITRDLDDNEEQIDPIAVPNSVEFERLSSFLFTQQVQNRE